MRKTHLEFRWTVTVTVTESLVLRLLLEDRGRITESIRILVPVDRMKQKCYQITTKPVRRLQQFQLRRQSVPCLPCSNRKGSVANSLTCPQHDEVATRWSAQCRSTWNTGDWCQKAWDIFRRMSKKWLVNQQARLYWILSATKRIQYNYLPLQVIPVTENKHSIGTDPADMPRNKLADVQKMNFFFFLCISQHFSSKPTLPWFYRWLSHTTFIGQLAAKPEILRPVTGLAELWLAQLAKSVA